MFQFHQIIAILSIICGIGFFILIIPAYYALKERNEEKGLRKVALIFIACGIIAIAIGISLFK